MRPVPPQFVNLADAGQPLLGMTGNRVSHLGDAGWTRRSSRYAWPRPQPVRAREPRRAATLHVTTIELSATLCNRRWAEVRRRIICSELRATPHMAATWTAASHALGSGIPRHSWRSPRGCSARAARPRRRCGCGGPCVRKIAATCAPDSSIAATGIAGPVPESRISAVPRFPSAITDAIRISTVLKRPFKKSM
jgi:hypothetical protein